MTINSSAWTGRGAPFTSRFASSCRHRIAIAGEGYRQCLRKWRRSPFVGDLRLIAIEHRHQYRKRLESGDLGDALNALFNAFHNGHFRKEKRNEQAKLVLIIERCKRGTVTRG